MEDSEKTGRKKKRQQEKEWENDNMQKSMGAGISYLSLLFSILLSYALLCLSLSSR